MSVLFYLYRICKLQTIRVFLFFLILLSGDAKSDYVYSVATTNKDYGVNAVATQVLDALGIRYETELYPPKRVYRYLRDGETDIWIANRGLEEISAHVVYADEPLLCLKLSAFTVDGSAVKRKEDLNGKSIIVIQGFTYLGWMDYFLDPQNGMEISKTPSRSSAYLMLKARRATYFLDYQVTTLENKALLEFPEFKSYDFWSKPIYFVFSKKTHELDSLKNKIDAYLKSKMYPESSQCEDG